MNTWTGTTIDLDTGRTRDAAALHGLALAWADVLARDHGVRAGDRVAHTAHASSDVFAMQLACSALGAILVPLSWRATPVERAAILASAAPAAIDPALPIDAPPTAVRIALAPDAIAHLLYTSGTTGAPRGIAIRGRQIAANAAATIATCALTARDRVLACLPMFHTGGLHCLATPALAAGATVAIAPRFEAHAAVAALAAHAITETIAVPAMYERMLDAGLTAARAPHLRLALVGGAPVTAQLRARAAAAGIPLHQGYGLTEAGPNCFDFGAGAHADTIGRPAPGLEARIDGPTGELHLRGAQVADAAWIDGALVPILDEDGWLHTGDLVGCDAADGRYRVVGRAKDIYISGGENVVPAEVEGALAEHPAIALAAVVGVPDARWGEVGAAAVVVRAPVDTAALVAFLRERIAAYKIPRHWRVVADLPRTATGKVARADLRRSWEA